MITYTYNFIGAEFDQNSDLEKTIKTLHWQLIASKDETTISIPFTTILDAAVEDNFISFEDIAKEQLITWVSDKMGNDYIDYIKNLLAEEIVKKKNFSSIEPFDQTIKN
jgi:hypothetical protein